MIVEHKKALLDFARQLKPAKTLAQQLSLRRYASSANVLMKRIENSIYIDFSLVSSRHIHKTFEGEYKMIIPLPENGIRDLRSVFEIRGPRSVHEALKILIRKAKDEAQKI